jgi:hypothetical protein
LAYITVFIAPTGVGCAGVISNDHTIAQQNAFQNISLSADATIGGTGRFDIRGGTPVLNLNGHTLTKTGTNQFSLVSAAVNSGNVVVNQGVFSIEAGTTIDNSVPTDTITVNTGATLQFFQNTGTVSRAIVINGESSVEHRQPNYCQGQLDVFRRGDKCHRWNY